MSFCRPTEEVGIAKGTFAGQFPFYLLWCVLVPTFPHHSTLEPDRSREAALRASARFSVPML